MQKDEPSAETAKYAFIFVDVPIGKEPLARLFSHFLLIGKGEGQSLHVILPDGNFMVDKTRR